jgi:NADPH2:quinone reductase
VGGNVKDFVIGDKVGAFTKFGGYAQFVRKYQPRSSLFQAVAEALGCFKVPEGMKMEEAAGIPVAYATAYHCLYNTGPLRKGDKVTSFFLY